MVHIMLVEAHGSALRQVWSDIIIIIIIIIRLGMLRHTRENLTTNCANAIYKSFILPIMDYCDAVWACCGKGNASVLEKQQRRAARTVMRSDSSD